MPDRQDSYFSTSLEKGLAILSHFDQDHPSRTLSELTKMTGINKTSVYRFVNTFVTLGYLRKNANSSVLHLGPKSYILGHRLLHGFVILQSVKPIIDKTFLEHRVSIDCAILHGQSLISLYRREAENLISLRLPLVMTDLHARAMGKAVLANMSPKDLSGFLQNLELEPITSNTITNVESLREELALCVARGYSINNEEYVKGLVCIGAPVTNYKTNKVAGAVSLDFPTSDFTLEQIEKSYTGILTKLANELSGIFTVVDV